MKLPNPQFNLKLQVIGLIKYLTYILIALGSYSVTIADEPDFCVLAHNMNVLYIGVDNPIQVFAAGFNLDEISLKSEECLITKRGKGLYSVTCSTGTKEVIIYATKNKGGLETKLNGKCIFRVKPLPDPVAQIGSMEHESVISNKVLLAADSITAVMKGFDYNLKIRVISYTMSINIGGGFKTVSAQGANYTPEVIALLNQVKNNGRVIFENIKVRMPDRTVRTLSPIVLKVTLNSEEIQSSETIKTIVKKGIEINIINNTTESENPNIVNAKTDFTILSNGLNFLYAGVNNPLKIFAPGYDEESINLKSDQCTIKKTGAGFFECTCLQNVQEATFYASVKKGDSERMLNGSFSFRVKTLPNPVVKVGGKESGGVVNKKLLMAAGGVAAVMKGVDLDCKAKVASYSVTVNVQGEFKTVSAQGANYTPEVIALLNQVKNNGRVIFENIYVEMQDGTLRILSPYFTKINGTGDEVQVNTISKEGFTEVSLPAATNNNYTENPETPFVRVEEMPEFPGGKDAMFEYISKNINYPEEEKNAVIAGTVYVYFVINKQGKATNVEVRRGVKNGPGLDREAVRIIQNMPPWSIGKQNGKPASVQFTLPVKFVLP